MAATYRGKPIKHALHDVRADTYSLIDAAGECIAELKACEFLSIPNRGNLEVQSGRHRPAGSKDQCGTNRKPNQTGRDDALDAFLFAGSPLWAGGATAKGPATGLTIADAQRAYSFLRSFSWQLCEDDAVRPALKRDGIVAGEIVGYRCWRIVRGDPQALIGQLRSVYQMDVWNPGDVLQGRELGDWDQRGIHAWKDSGSREYHAYIRGYLNRANEDPFSFAFNNGGDVDTSERRPAMVTGTVFLWGDVVEHERGWRAEFARVRTLDWLYPDALMMGREAEALDGLRRLYQVDRSTA